MPACECHLPLPKTISLDVLGKLLTVGISDPSRNLNNCSSFCINLGIFFSSLCIWKIVLAGFDAPFDLKSLFSVLHDENFEVTTTFSFLIYLGSAFHGVMRFGVVYRLRVHIDTFLMDGMVGFVFWKQYYSVSDKSTTDITPFRLALFLLSRLVRGHWNNTTLHTQD